jgi:hypothetical protein
MPDQEKKKDWRGSGPHRRLKSQRARPGHFQPAIMRGVNSPHDNTVAMSAPQNCSHLGRVKTQRANGCDGTACPASNSGARNLGNKDFLKETCGGIAVENDARAIFCFSHGLCSRGSEAFRLDGLRLMSKFHQHPCCLLHQRRGATDKDLRILIWGITRLSKQRFIYSSPRT